MGPFGTHEVAGDPYCPLGTPQGRGDFVTGLCERGLGKAWENLFLCSVHLLISCCERRGVIKFCLVGRERWGLRFFDGWFCAFSSVCTEWGVFKWG